MTGRRFQFVDGEREKGSEKEKMLSSDRQFLVMKIGRPKDYKSEFSIFNDDLRNTKKRTWRRPTDLGDVEKKSRKLMKFKVTPETEER